MCLTDRRIEVFFRDFDEGAITLEARFWIDFERQRDYAIARSEAIVAIRDGLATIGVQIPYPAIALHDLRTTTTDRASHGT